MVFMASPAPNFNIFLLIAQVSAELVSEESEQLS